MLTTTRLLLEGKKAQQFKGKKMGRRRLKMKKGKMKVKKKKNLRTQMQFTLPAFSSAI
jgi:hypothetical protein